MSSQFPVFKAYHNKEKPIILNMEDLFFALYEYIHNNKNTFLPLLSEEDAANYDNYLRLIKDYYIEKPFHFLRVSPDDVASDYGVTIEKGLFVTEKLFPFNLIHSLGIKAEYPIPVEGDLIDQITRRLRSAYAVNMKVAIGKFNVPPKRISAMLRTFNYSYFSITDDGRGSLLEIERIN